MKNLRSKLRSGHTVVGTWCNSGSPIIAELMSASGFDFVCVDAEHSAVDVPQAQTLFQAVAAGSSSCAPIVRLHGVDYALVKRYLDAGARGVICPLINTRADAELLVSAVKYPPEGRRGVGFCRANQFGVRVSEEYKQANHEILTAVQIEHIDGVHNIHDILSVPGIDAAFIGPYDLTASMGITAQFDHPEYIQARDRILHACQEKGVVPGIHVVQPNTDELIARAHEGYRFLAYSLDITMLLHTCQAGVAKLKGFLAHRELESAGGRTED
ncbi:MAG: 2,4-dihydroxyhept-2-ene-1,7-dioic acid aldolase [Verrucomicrobiae bacterium]|nr:2,4-dihydroxyhept-2-ene-1,7-dioic acid aldolase [Verrucomicrobiae bacterium]